MNWQTIAKNWKTTAAGVVAFLFSCPTFVSAFEAWSHHQAVDWRSLAFGIAMFAVSSGLIAAKDSTNHSTVAEVQAATRQQLQEAGKTIPRAPAAPAS